MKKLADVKDDNGTSLQSYADVLLQKADAAGVTVIVLAMVPNATPTQSLADLIVMHNVASIAALPDVLNQLASQMRKKPVRYEERSDLQGQKQN